MQAAREAAEEGHRVSILAIGTLTGGPIPDPDGGLKRDSRGQLRLSKSNFPLMERVSRAGNGSLVELKTSSTYAELLASRVGASELIATEQLADESSRGAANDGIWIVWIMLPLALLLFRRNLLWVMVAGLLLHGPDEPYAGERDSFWSHPEQEAYKAFIDGDYQASYELSSDPGLQAAALYRNGNYQQALRLYLEIPTAQSAYNRGNTLTQLHQFEDAILAYEEALSLDPELGAARYNKRLLEWFLLQQSENEGDAQDDAAQGNTDTNTPDSPDAETRIGASEQRQTNPAEELQLGSGLGASLQSGQVDPFEQFDSLDEEAERFDLMALGENQQQSEVIEQWIRTLPETSTDLYRRKFLRDYERQQLQSR